MNSNISTRDAKHYEALAKDLQDANDIAHKPHLIESLIRELDTLDATYGSEFSKLFVNNKTADSIFTLNNILVEHNEYRASAGFKSNDYQEKFGSLSDGVEDTDFAIRDANGIYKPITKEFIAKILDKVAQSFPKLSKDKQVQNVSGELKPTNTNTRIKRRI